MQTTKPPVNVRGVYITVRPMPGSGASSRSLSMYSTTVEEMVAAIRKMGKKSSRGT